MNQHFHVADIVGQEFRVITSQILLQIFSFDRVGFLVQVESSNMIDWKIGAEQHTDMHRWM